MHVLVVEDDDEYARLFVTVLTKEGHTWERQATAFGIRNRIVTRGESGQLAPVDAVVLDLMLPGLSGESALEILARDPACRRVPVILHSAHLPSLAPAHDTPHPNCLTMPKGVPMAVLVAELERISNARTSSTTTPPQTRTIRSNVVLDEPSLSGRVRPARIMGGRTEPRGRVLLLDDSEVVRELVSDELQSRGYEVVTLESPIGMTRMLHNCKPDVVLVDVRLPGMSGDRLVEFVRTQGVKDARIILYSDTDAAELAQLARNCGADSYLTKSSDLGPLMALVAEFTADVRRGAQHAPR